MACLIIAGGNSRPLAGAGGQSASASVNTAPGEMIPVCATSANGGAGLTTGPVSSAPTCTSSPGTGTASGAGLSSSPAASGSSHPPLLRQETFSMSKITKSLRSLSDETTLESSGNLRSVNSLLESDEAKLTPESIEKLRENKSVAKIASKMEKELSLLQKKHEKAKEREINSIMSKEGKIIKQQSALVSKKSGHKNPLASTLYATSGSSSASASASVITDAR